MFKNCSAYTIASETEWQGRLSGLLRQVGFRQSTRLEAVGRMAAADTDALNFLVMHSSKSKDLIYNVTEAVRSSNDDKIRFMPVIVLLDESLESAVYEFINLGCDDIIIYPCSAKLIAQRLELQVTTKRDYYETDTYFGPDRRILGADRSHPDRRGGADSTYRQIVIKRELSGKINFVLDKMHTPAPEQVAI